jgi:PAS domain S-box-containing protein
MKKQILLFLAVFIVLAIFHEYFYNGQLDKLTKQIHKNKSDEIIKLFNDEVEKKFGKTFGLTYLLSKDKKLIDALVAKDSSQLDYKKTIDKIEEFGEYKNLWIQIIDKDGYSFYRSWTKKVGDHTASARLDIADMLKKPKPMRGISTGRFDMTFKTMIPLYNGKEFIGMIEMISKFNSIAIILKDHEVEPLMVLHEDYTQRFIKPFTGLFIDDNYVANLNASKELMQKVEKYGLKKLMYLKAPMVFEKYMVTTTQIKDVRGGEMGFFIFFFEENMLDKSLLYNFKISYYTGVIVLLILVILIILYTSNRKNAEKLNQEVEKKTLKIQKQQKDLETILKTYDDNVIFSKTDLKGNIIYASKAFCDISGYTQGELIGEPHNIVRHPDMPAEAFKNMWKTIKRGDVWEDEVKNLKKDGSCYWVYSRIEPIFEAGDIIGYVSTRTDITAKKEYEEQQLKMLDQAKMAAMGEMLGNIAHQWRQPLSIITTVASSISYKQELGILNQSDIIKEMDHITENANYLSNTIETFRNFLKNKKEYQAICIQESIESILHILASMIKNYQIKVIDHTKDIERITIGMVSGELEQVIINIINNAKDVFEERDIKERLLIIDLVKEDEKVILSLEDNAGGIAENIIDKIFDAYFTTKHQSRGTGMGLNMSYRIITESLNGDIYVKNTKNGAKFIIELPLR